jgi:hypothetical protein
MVEDETSGDEREEVDRGKEGGGRVEAGAGKEDGKGMDRAQDRRFS